MPHSESGEPQPQQQKVEIWVAPEPVPDLTAQAAPDTFKKVVTFLVNSQILEESTTDPERVQAGLKKFQRTKGLPETGVYDAPTKDAMNLATRWCGVPDTKASFVLGGGRWDHTALTYSFDPLP
jgi:murein L,D-transpeptidase YcbB/YkuD